MFRIESSNVAARWTGSALLGAAVVMLGALTAPRAEAAVVYYVDDDAEADPGPGDSSVSDPLEDGSLAHPFDAIQEGMDAAVDGDEVVILAGLYRGAGNHDLDFGGKAITVRSESGPEVTIVDSTIDPEAWPRPTPHDGFIFESGEGSDSVLRGLTLTDSWLLRAGGGIIIRSSSPTIEDCTISSHIVREHGGGGIFCFNASPMIRNCTIEDNFSGQDGGGIYCGGTGSPTIVGCTIEGNDCVESGGGVFFGGTTTATMEHCTIRMNGGAPSGGSGGGVGCGDSSQPSIRHCTIIGNRRGRGGGVGVLDQSRPLITDCAIKGNRADHGGGINCMDQSRATITHCALSANWAGQGGGLRVLEAAPTIRDCVITGNQTRGVYISEANPTMERCAIVGNSGGIHVTQSAEPLIRDCLIAANRVGYRGGGIECTSGGHAVVANCTIAHNHAADGGGISVRRGHPTLTSCILVDNDAARGPEIALMTDHRSDLTVGYSDVAGAQAEVYVEGDSTLNWLAGNIDADPGFTHGPGGTWTNDGAFDAETLRVTLTDDTAAWTEGEWIGKLINPDVSQPLQLVIVANTADTITVLADYDTIVPHPGASWVTAGATYQIFDYHLPSDSPCVNRGDPAFAPEPDETDIDDEPRVQHCRVDMGSDETPYFRDCQPNGVADACDILDGASLDIDENGVPDECESLATDLPIRINAGGPVLAAADESLPQWAEDTEAQPSPLSNHLAAGNRTATRAVAITLDPSVPAHVPAELFQTERWGPPAHVTPDEMEWNVPLAPGQSVEVRLYFAET